MCVWPCVHARTHTGCPQHRQLSDDVQAIGSSDTQTGRSSDSRVEGTVPRGQPPPETPAGPGCSRASYQLAVNQVPTTPPRARLMSGQNGSQVAGKAAQSLGHRFIIKVVKDEETQDEVPRKGRLSLSVGLARWPASRPSGFSRGLHWVALTDSVFGHWTRTQPPAPGTPWKSGWA